ncbi:tripartite motif-containing protein 16-like isoform X2 [Cyclopterus lumpus]|uniref:tripartite motif-containing protein 16-like isoform X2 n=1 Tax=Cyclopterus lumpus TaxID=8103 RepID=UPI001485EF3A|nr:tripartite motif-containing protein 16-like isoform X2 [Cyclopterus lumpus]
MAEAVIILKKNRLCCQVCGELFRNPATISCGHSFCTRCILDRLDGDERKKRACVCPECGHRFPSRPRPIKNTTLADLVRDTERRDDKRKHPGASTQDPTRATGSCAVTRTSSGSNLCVRHSSPLNVYCCTDKQIICAVCASAEHKGHTIGYVREERRRKQKELRIIQTKSKQILQEQEKKCKNMGKTLKQIQEEARETQNYCESVLAGIINSIQRHHMSVRELIRGHEEQAAAQVEISIQTLQVKMEAMRKRDAGLDRLAQTDSDARFLQGWPLMQHLCEKDHLHLLHEDSEDPLLPFEFTKRAVDKLGEQLEEFCDQRFASISQTADGGEQQESEEESEEDDMQERCEASKTESQGLSRTSRTEPNVEPKTRAEFLQYACGLSLDPTTAHENLTISAGDKEVRLSPLKGKSPAVRCPQRFLHRKQVLCREGLQAERCYYEIEVEGDKAEIALAYKGIDRRSRTPLSAFGANANSWSLDRYANYSVSHRADSVQLTTCPSQRKLGVYLNFKEGTLSFYEVADRMMFLYKVEAEFTEPLYPGFWLGEDCCIRICDLRRDAL